MRRRLVFTGLWLGRLAASQLTADIYLPIAPNPSQAASHPTISSPQLNAILSHQLNISHFETLPQSLHPEAPIAQLVFGNPHASLPLQSPTTVHRPQLVLVLYGAGGQKLLPAQILAQSQPFELPNPPDILSFDALLSIFVGRIVETFKVSIPSLYGAHDFVQAYHHGIGLDLLDNIYEWASDWTYTLPDWIEWAKTLSVKPSEANQSEDENPDHYYINLLKDYGPLDHAAYQLIEDMKKLANFKTMTSGKELPQRSFIRLSSLQQVQRRHSENSHQYRSGVEGLKKMISELLLDPSLRQMDNIILAIPAQPVHARLGKRTSLSILSPFKTSEHSFIKRDLLERRRSVFSSSAPVPIIPSSRRCFETKAACEKDSEACNGHGSCIEGQKTSGGKCFVCLCQPTKDTKIGKVTHWSGDSCQKQDLSSGFVLLTGSAIGLVILFGLAVGLLMSVGSHALPQQLASVSGSSKKLD